VNGTLEMRNGGKMNLVLEDLQKNVREESEENERKEESNESKEKKFFF